jgi:hypothetical protein
MAQIRFDHLVTALADAVVKAEHVVRVHQINDIRSFFDERNQPVSVPLEIQRTDPAAKLGDMTQLNVPLITLINMGHLSIKEMEIEFTTALGEMSEQTDRRPYLYPAVMGRRVSGGKPPRLGADLPEIDSQDDQPTHDLPPFDPAEEALGWTADRDVRLIEVETSGPDSSSATSAKITLKVKAGETPEGLARLIDRLNRLI